jgi:hypothetical protein
MAKLVLSRGNSVLGHYFLDKDRFVIGRKSSCDIMLDDPGVSKEHALIVTLGNDQILEDPGSTNGTAVNGKKVKRHILQNNDVIGIGDFELKYVNQRASKDIDFDKTLMLAGGGAPLDANTHAVSPEELKVKPQLSTAVSSARSVKASFPLGGVKGVNGALAGQEIIISRPLKTFGVEGKQTAMISRRPHGYYVTHVDGRKRPRVNGKTIGTQPHALHNNDLIEIAGEKLIFFLK